MRNYSAAYSEIRTPQFGSPPHDLKRAVRAEALAKSQVDVKHRQWFQVATAGKCACIDRLEAKIFDELAHRELRCRVVAAVEHRRPVIAELRVEHHFDARRVER